MGEKKSKKMKIPILKCLLQFEKKYSLETGYQKKSRKISYLQMRYLGLILNIFGVIYTVVNIYRYFKSGQKGSSSQDSMDERRYYIMSICAPLNMLILNMDLLLMRLSRGYSKIRGNATLISTFILVGIANSYVYQEEEVFGTYSLIAPTLAYWAVQHILYNWISACFSLFIGISGMVCSPLIFGLPPMKISRTLAFLLLFGILVQISRSAEIQKRREFYILDSAKKRQREWEKVLTTLPLGVVIHKKIPTLLAEDEMRNFQLVDDSLSVVAQSLQPEVQFWNPAMIDILRSNIYIYIYIYIYL